MDEAQRTFKHPCVDYCSGYKQAREETIAEILALLRKEPWICRDGDRWADWLKANLSPTPGKSLDERP